MRRLLWIPCITLAVGLGVVAYCTTTRPHDARVDRGEPPTNDLDAGGTERTARGATGRLEVRGRLVDALDEPLLGGVVTVEPVRREGFLRPDTIGDAIEVASDDHGRFVAYPEHPGPLAVTVTHHDFPPRIVTTQLRVRSDQPADLGDLVLRSRLGIVAAVRSARSQAPIEGAELSLRPALHDTGLGPRAASRLVQRATTDQTGRAVIPGVAPGAYRLRVAAAGAATIERIVYRGEDAERPQSVRVDLPPGVVLRGRVEDGSGSSVAQAWLLWRSTEGAAEAVTRSGDDGDFRLSELPLSAGTLWALAPAGAKALSLTPPDPRERVVVRLDPLRIARGRAIAADTRAPIGGARIVLEAGDDWPLFHRGRVAAPSAVSRRDGFFEISGVPPGRFRLLAASELFVPTRAGPFSTVDQEPSVVPLRRARFAAARIVDATGLPLAGARIEVMPEHHDGTALADWLQRAAGPMPSTAGTRTGADGGFRAHGLAAGRYRLRVAAAGHATLLTAPFEVPETAPGIELGALQMVAGATLSGTTRRADGTPAPYATVCGDPVGADGRLGATAVSDRDGQFVLGPLAPGSYEVFYYFPDTASVASAADSHSTTKVRVLVQEGTPNQQDLIVR